MIRRLCVAFVLAHAAPAFAQASGELPVGSYALTASVPVVACDFNGANPSGSVQYPPDGARFRYLQTSADGKLAVIQFFLWKPEDANYKLFNFADGAATRKTFCVERTVFDRFSRSVFASGWSSYQLAAGALVLPVKIRFGGSDRSFDFSKDITISTTGGFRWRVSDTRDNYVSALIGVGLSSVSLNALNTRNVVKESTDRAALTWISGVMFDVSKFQFGAFLGQDRISQPNQADWTYQGKTWLAVGLGYTLFGPSSPSTDKTDAQQKP